MALTPPSVEVFLARFPQFSDTPTSAIEAALADAALSVDERWIEADRVTAMCYLAAHLLSLQGYGGSSSGGGGAGATGEVTSIQVGDVKTTFANRTGGAGTGNDDSWYALTRFGQYFLVLMRRSLRGPRVAAKPLGLPYCDPWYHPLNPKGWLA